MCGIIGYVGDGHVIPMLLDGLERLSYRGYDSAGIAVADDRALYVKKVLGTVSALRAEVNGNGRAWRLGIGHTRWATHGEPSVSNAHPHMDCEESLAVVHNGIIENHEVLREQLAREGHKIRSQTDTELLAHLIEDQRGTLDEAVRRALAQVSGSMAVLVLDTRQPGELVAARVGTSPLVVSQGASCHYVASDVQALLPFTNDFCALDDGEMAVISRSQAKFQALCAHAPPPAAKQRMRVDWSPERAERGGHPHFMLKEIYEQPLAIRDTMAGRLKASGEVSMEDTELSAEHVRNVRRVIFVACGTSYHAGMVGKNLFQSLLRIPTEVAIASEFRYGNPILRGDDLVVAISQSGETADTIGSVEEARSQGARVLAISNVVGSTLTRIADHSFSTRAGPEIAVASTKTFLAQLTAIYLLALQFKQLRSVPDCEPWREMVAGLRVLPSQIEDVLGDQDDVQAAADEFLSAEACFVIGRGLDEAIAHEAALKLKEVPYIHAHSYPAGELKHGPLALMDPRHPVIALLTQSAVREKMLSNISEVLARKAPVILLAPRGEQALEGEVRMTIPIPRTSDLVAPLLATVPLQLLAYYAGVRRGCPVDTPRHLAKSVTVE